MKNFYSYFLAAFLFLLLNAGTLPLVSAQSWLWGQAATGGAFVDSWPAATDHSGNVYGAGVSEGSPISFSGKTVPISVGVYQSIWAKYDPTGAVLWADGTVSGNTYLYNIATDPSDNLIVFGSFSSATMQIGSFTLTNAYLDGSSQFYLAKINPAGTVLWAINDGNAYPGWFYTFSTFMMSTGSVATDAAGNIYITSAFDKNTMTIGSTTLTNAGPAGSFDVFVAKYSPTGAPVWASSIGGTGDDYGFGITVSSLGDVYVAGDFLSPSFKVGSAAVSNPYINPLAYIAKFSSTGVPTWGQSAGGHNGAFAVGLAKDNSGNVYMTGGFQESTISFGATTIARTYPADTPLLALYLVQYSPTNVVTWSKTIGSRKTGVFGFCIALASCGQVWVSGNYTDSAVIGTGDTLAPIAGGRDQVFIAGYNLSGSVVGYAGLGGGGDDQNGIACDAAGNVFICSDFFPPTLTVGTDIITGTGSEAFYVAKYQNVIPLDTIYASKDTVMCVSKSGTALKATSGYSTYLWDNGSTDSTRIITTSGTYYVYCVTCGDPVLVDTFHVKASVADSTYNRTDTSVCSSVKTITLNGPPGYLTYGWSTGSTASSIVATATGQYIVKAISGCGMVVDTFNLTIIPVDTTLERIRDTVCASVNPLTLTAPVGYTTYLWNTGSTAASILVDISSVSKSGTYRVYSTKGCETLTDSFYVTVKPVPVVSLGNDTTFCIGNTITLTSPQPPGSNYLWNTGSTATSISASTTGKYWLDVTAVNGCMTPDSIMVNVSPFPVVDLGPDTAVCTGIIPTLQSSVTYPSGSIYLWNTGSATSSIPGSVIGQYWLQVTVGVCTSADTMIIENLYDTLNFQMRDTAICRGDTVAVVALGTPGMTYQWLPTAGIPSSTTASTVIYPDTSATYSLTASISTCPDIVETFHLDVQPNPTVYIGEYRSVCQFDSLHIIASVKPQWYTHYIYNWSPATYLDNSTMSAVVFTPGDRTNLVLTVSTPAGCKGVDSTQLIVYPGNFASLDTTIDVCPHDSVRLMPKGGIAYNWHPGMYLSDSTSAAPWVRAVKSIDYTVIAYSEYGCKDTVSAKVIVGPSAEMYLADSVTLYPGESYQISPQTNCVYFSWFPPQGLNNAYISDPVAMPEVNTKYIVNATNEWGCKIIDSINIYIDAESVLTVPNAFTPGNGPNSEFKIIKKGIATLNYFRIYNRWGNVVYESSNIDAGWDGTYHGVAQPFDVYVYEISAVTSAGTNFNKHGNVTLVR